MTLVRICPGCSFQNSADEFFCKKSGCGTSLVLVQPISLPDYDSGTHSNVIQSENSSNDNKLSGIHCPNPECNFDGNPINEQTCLRCGTILDSLSLNKNATTNGTQEKQLIGLRFPFGDIWVDGILRIGRDPDFSPIADQIKNFDRVSRCHAEVRISDDRITVVDNSSTNKVHVNGHQITANAPHVLKIGDQINFSSQLQVMVICGDS